MSTSLLFSLFFLELSLKGNCQHFENLISFFLQIQEEQKNPQVKIFCRSRDKGIYCFLMTSSMTQTSNVLYVSPLKADILVHITYPVFVRSDRKSTLTILGAKKSMVISEFLYFDNLTHP